MVDCVKGFAHVDGDCNSSHRRFLLVETRGDDGIYFVECCKGRVFGFEAVLGFYFGTVVS